MSKVDEIKEITKEEASILLSSRKKESLYGYEPWGKFYTAEKDEDSDTLYVGYDNSDGHCWVECFGTKEKCIAWLKGEFEIDD